MFNDCRAFVWGDGKVLEMDGGDGCTTLGMFLLPLNCMLKMVKVVKFYVNFTIVFKKEN